MYKKREQREVRDQLNSKEHKYKDIGLTLEDLIIIILSFFPNGLSRFSLEAILYIFCKQKPNLRACGGLRREVNG